MPQIRRALGIAGVATKTFAYQTDGAQVDMVIERADKTVCMCEMKWSAMPYAIKKAAGKREKSDACIDSSEREQARAKLNAENGKIGNRLMAVREKYPRYALMVVMVTSGGLVQNRRTSERRGRAGSDYPEREGGKPEVNEYAMQTVQREVTLEDLFW